LTVATYVMCFLVVGVLAAVAIIYQRWWWGSRRVPDAIARAERTNLLQAIEEAATEPQMHVTLSGFWRGNGWSRREKADLLRPLIEQRVLHIPYSSEQPQRFFEHVWYDAFGQPPGTVILNSRDWTRMATDKSGKEPSIIIGKISGGNNQIGGRENTITQQDLATDQLVALSARSELTPTPRQVFMTTPSTQQTGLRAGCMTGGSVRSTDGSRLLRRWRNRARAQWRQRAKRSTPSACSRTTAMTRSASPEAIVPRYHANRPGPGSAESVESLNGPARPGRAGRSDGS